MRVRLTSVAGICTAVLLAGVGGFYAHAAQGAVDNHNRSNLSGTILHIVRVAPDEIVPTSQGQLRIPGHIYESWTDITHGTSKVVDTDGHGVVSTVRYESKRGDGTVAETVVEALITKTGTIPSSAVGRLKDAVWYGGERSLAGMQAEYASYLAQAGSQVVQDTLNGATVRRFDATSPDGLVGTIWLNDAGLPVQVESGHNSKAITKFPIIAELPASSVSPGFLTSTTIPTNLYSKSLR